MFKCDDVFITEYLKIINEANKDDKAEFNNFQPRIKIERNINIQNEIPELDNILKTIFKIKNKSENWKTYQDIGEANDAIEKFINRIKEAIDNIKIDKKLQKQLDEKFGSKTDDESNNDFDSENNSDEKTDEKTEEKTEEKSEKKTKKKSSTTSNSTKKSKNKSPDATNSIKRDENGNGKVSTEIKTDDMAE